MTDKTKKTKVKSSANPLPSFRMEGDGRGSFISVTFSGILGVKELSDKEIRISTKKESINLCGNKLSITVFENKTVEISGFIESINFLSKARERGKR